MFVCFFVFFPWKREIELEQLELIIQATDMKTRVTYSRDERRLRLNNVSIYTYV